MSELEFGQIYEIIPSKDTVCDNCGNRFFTTSSIIAKYDGEMFGTHYFTIAPASCMGCKSVISQYALMMAMNVTEEIEGIK